MTGAAEAKLLEAFWPADLPTRVNVWAVLDGARDRRIFSAVDRTSQDKCCLYAGDLPWQLEMAAPYLVQLERDDWFTHYLLEHGWGNSWGIFFRSETSLKNLRHHLRGFLRVRDEANHRLLFRYYDPRVLRVYLPTCRRAELETMFGPIDRFLMEGEDPDSLIEDTFDGKHLQRARVSLVTDPALR